ncbi:MAG: sigma-70 family RNA polymerase sigma factor [Bacteroidota bacterium]|jgi:RNA polymerase sigma-70 factor (ECF subfamily)
MDGIEKGSSEGAEQAAAAAAAFEPLRPQLLRTAYRMLGSVADAEDVVQEAFVRWLKAARGQVRKPREFLRQIVTHLCLDHLKSARTKRETYVGFWLPEPVLESEDESVGDVTLPLMLALERLSPLERAAFILHDAFGLTFGEIARIIGRTPAACRQLALRARRHVRAKRPRFPLPKERGLEIAAAFFTASRSGDLERLSALLAADVAVYVDGGGKTTAPLTPVVGRDNVLALFAQLASTFAEAMSRLVRYGTVNGLPGFVTIERDNVLQATALALEGGRIAAIYVMRNPDKTKHLDRLVAM